MRKKNDTKVCDQTWFSFKLDSVALLEGSEKTKHRKEDYLRYAR